MRFIKKNGRVIPIKDKPNDYMKYAKKEAKIAAVGAAGNHLLLVGIRDMAKTMKLDRAAKTLTGKLSGKAAIGGLIVTGAGFASLKNYANAYRNATKGNKTKAVGATLAGGVVGGTVANKLLNPITGRVMYGKKINPWRDVSPLKPKGLSK